MQLLVLASIAVSTLVGGWVGARLIRMARGTGELPELLVGVALFVYAALSQPTALLVELLPDAAPVGLRMALTTLRLVGFYVTLVALAAFVCRVFGAASRARLALVATACLAGLLGYGFILADTWGQLTQGETLGVLGRLGMTPAFILVYAWSASESLRYHGLMQRRRAVGLADPVVTNRFLVWGAGSAAGAVLLAGLLANALFPGRDATTNLLISGSGVVSAATWWLAFAPPAWYCDRLRSRALAA